MKFVRWKPYGFTHILPDVVKPHKYGGPTTLCGNSASHYSNFRLPGWVTTTEKKAGLKPGDDDPRLLRPSDEDDGKRPLCGLCRKAAKLDG